MFVTTFIPLVVDILGSTLFVLQNSWHFQTVEEYSRIYFIKIPDIFRQWRNMVGSILFVRQNAWHFWIMVGSILFVLQNSWHFQVMEKYGMILELVLELVGTNSIWSILFVLTFSKSANYFWIILGILWNMWVLVYFTCLELLFEFCTW